MKKVVGIFLTMVFVFVMVNMAFADIYPTYGEAEEMLKEWAMLSPFRLQSLFSVI